MSKVLLVGSYDRGSLSLVGYVADDNGSLRRNAAALNKESPLPYITKQKGSKITRHWVGPLPTEDEALHRLYKEPEPVTLHIRDEALHRLYKESVTQYIRGAVDLIGSRTVSEFAGVSQRTVQRWVTGERFPTQDQQDELLSRVEAVFQQWLDHHPEDPDFRYLSSLLQEVTS